MIVRMRGGEMCGVEWDGSGAAMATIAELAKGTAMSKLVPCNVFGRLCLEIQRFNKADLVVEPGQLVVKDAAGELSVVDKLEEGAPT